MMLHGEFFFLAYLVPDPVMHEHEGVHVCELRCLNKFCPSQVPLWVGTDW